MEKGCKGRQCLEEEGKEILTRHECVSEDDELIQQTDKETVDSPHFDYHEIRTSFLPDI